MKLIQKKKQVSKKYSFERKAQLEGIPPNSSNSRVTNLIFLRPNRCVQNRVPQHGFVSKLVTLQETVIFAMQSTRWVSFMCIIAVIATGVVGFQFSTSKTHGKALKRAQVSMHSGQVEKWLKSAGAAGLATLAFGLNTPLVSHAANEVPSISANTPIYFGVGCFWHVQHEFVSMEKKVLGREGLDLSSRAGYAGGTRTGKDTNRPDNKKGLVCYHNMMNVGDYGSLGHGEVVGMQLPSESIGAFADQYFALFGTDNERPDKGDRGAEYRSLLGLPGGIDSPYFRDIEASLGRSGKKLQLVAGLGNDKDTLGKGKVWVMDSDKYPFYPAEMYHQFHDGFMPGEQYPQGYNAIARQLYDAGKLGSTGCPDSAPRG
jgi:peptide methionine sulfoxide reductase MsrA